jgi:hypothetical protein
MLDLSRFLTNPFDNGKTSVAELLAFATDHLQRMVTHDADGALTARIAATSTSLGHVEDGVSDAKVKLGLRKARKQVKDDFHGHLAERVARIGAAVVGKFGAGAAELTECLPHGHAVFSECRDDQVAAHLQTLIDGVTALQPALGLAPLTDATNLLAAWTTVHKASEISTSRKTTTQENRNASRAALQDVLFTNLLDIARMFPGQPENLERYMRQSLLENPSEAVKGPAPVA